MRRGRNRLFHRVLIMGGVPPSILLSGTTADFSVDAVIYSHRPGEATTHANHPFSGRGYVTTVKACSGAFPTLKKRVIDIKDLDARARKTVNQRCKHRV